MAVDTFYFDGHTSITDPGGVWTNDSNVFDGSTTTNAVASSNGSTSSNYLEGQGTNASGITGTITQVRARIRGYSALDNGYEYSAYDTLNEPSGGWSLAAVQDLEVRIWRTGGVVSRLANFAVYEDGDAGGTILGQEATTLPGSSSPTIVEVEVTWTEGETYLLLESGGAIFQEGGDLIEIE